MTTAINPALEAEYLELLASHAYLDTYGSNADLIDAVFKAIKLCNGMQGSERAFVVMINPTIERRANHERDVETLEPAKKWAKVRAAALLATCADARSASCS